VLYIFFLTFFTESALVSLNTRYAALLSTVFLTSTLQISGRGGHSYSYFVIEKEKTQKPGRVKLVIPAGDLQVLQQPWPLLL